MEFAESRLPSIVSALRTSPAQSRSPIEKNRFSATWDTEVISHDGNGGAGTKRPVKY